MRTRKIACWMLAGILLTVSLSAFADRDDWRWRGRGDWHDRGWGWRAEPFYRGPDLDRWRGGYWTHGDYDGRWGWWWVVNGLWYFYPRPVYPYPAPYYDAPPYAPTEPALPTPAAPPVQQYWYYCDGAKAYYPYVKTCPGGWKEVPATPAPSP